MKLLKYILPFLVFCIILFCGYEIFSIKQAYAQKTGGYTQADLCWGSGCPESATHPDQNICPKTGLPDSGKRDAAGILVVINSTGTTPIPPGQQFTVYINPTGNALGQGDNCSDVTCLKRSTTWSTKTSNGYSGGWPAGKTSWNLPLFNQIGCSSGACLNNFAVSVRMVDPPAGLDCANDDKTINITNGVFKTVTVDLNCKTPGPVCPDIPKPTVVITCPDGAGGCN